MDAPPNPGPVLSHEPPILTPTSDTPALPIWRRASAFILLAGYPLLLSVISTALDRAGLKAPKGATLLPTELAELWISAAENLFVFGVWFAAAAWLGRLHPRELHADRRPKPSAVLWGLGWSIALRLALAALLFLVIGIILITHGIKDLDADFIQKLRPRVENLVSPESLRSPWYLFTNLTLVSFVLAGLREELWRAGMIAAGINLLSKRWRGTRGQVLLVFVSSVVFGLAHLPQGWGGVVMTGVLGLGLGSILVFHRCLWIAVLAHGFFDASTFVVLWLLDSVGLLKDVLK
jgi:hypothetical protein